tara:strand:+ start:194 stop:478 length:285 start_codon:yes stop_codon:yes gene_type:complete
MGKNFLDKVASQIVSETIIDYDRETIRTPFPLINPNAFASYLFTPSSPIFHGQPSPFISFIKHCRDIYGLNDGEVDYVWVKWRDTIKYKKEYGE